MPHRDPETGQFVAGRASDMTWQETTAILTTTGTQIPAADLTGGNTDHDPLQDADVTQVLDFSGHLDSDEVFELIALDYHINLALPATASAESSALAAYVYSRVPDVFAPNPSFWATGQRESGVYDVNGATGGDEDASVLHQGELAATADFGDSTNGLGAGAFIGYDSNLVPFRALYGVGPMFDMDDEIYFPVVFYSDNISDHAIHLTQRAEWRGIVHEAD